MYEFKIEKMHCMSCVRNILESLREYDESIKVSANLEIHVLTVETEKTLQEVAKIIEEAGYPINKVLPEQT